jgi:macrolide-specific efflux system membrane fusion protein
MKIIRILGLLVAVVMLLTSCSGKQDKKLDTAVVTRGNISASINSVGEVLPYNRVVIQSVVAGRIEDIFVNEGDHVKKGQILATVSSTDRATLLDAARTKGASEVKYWQDVYKPSPVIAPLDGFIIDRTFQPGQSIDTTSALLVMADHLIVQAQVDETDLGKIKLGQKAVIAVDAYPNQKINGSVEHIAYEAQTINNVTVYIVYVFPVRVPDFFRSGQSANVNFTQDEKKNVLILPSNAVRKVKGRSYVFVPSKNSDGYDMQSVSASLESVDSVEIASGLKEGDIVLIPSAKMVQDMQSGPKRSGMPGIFGGRR